MAVKQQYDILSKKVTHFMWQKVHKVTKSGVFGIFKNGIEEYKPSMKLV